MITYKKPFPETMPNFEVPVLHRVNVSPATYFSREFNTWLITNCISEFYTSPSYAGTFVQFVDDKDAVMCSLRWLSNG